MAATINGYQVIMAGSAVLDDGDIFEVVDGGMTLRMDWNRPKGAIPEIRHNGDANLAPTVYHASFSEPEDPFAPSAQGWGWGEDLLLRVFVTRGPGSKVVSYSVTAGPP